MLTCTTETGAGMVEEITIVTIGSTGMIDMIDIIEAIETGDPLMIKVLQELVDCYLVVHVLLNYPIDEQYFSSWLFTLSHPCWALFLPVLAINKSVLLWKIARK